MQDDNNSSSDGPAETRADYQAQKAAGVGGKKSSDRNDGTTPDLDTHSSDERSSSRSSHAPTLKDQPTEKYASQDLRDMEVQGDLLKQFYSSLRVMHLASVNAPARIKSLDEQHNRIEEILYEQPLSWISAYEVEQLLCFVMTDEQLSTELPRRLSEMKALQLTYAGVLETELVAIDEKIQALIDEEDQVPDKVTLQRYQSAKRFLMQRMLNDLQWFYKQRIRRRAAAKQLYTRVSALFLSAFVIFAFLIFVQYFSVPWLPQHVGSTGQGVLDTSEDPNGTR